MAREAATRFERAWPSFVFRILAIPSAKPDQFQPLFVRLQLCPTEHPHELKVPVRRPLVLQGSAPSSALADLLLAWAQDTPYRISDQCVLLPAHAGDELSWDLIADMPWRSLLQPLPGATSPHNIYWLEGGGRRLDPVSTQIISEARTNIGFSMGHYLGEQWSTNEEYFQAAIPVPIAVDARCDAPHNMAHVEIRCGQPFGPEQFRARVNKGSWDESEPELTFTSTGPPTSLWTTGVLNVPLPSPEGFAIWVYSEATEEFRWNRAIKCSAGDTLASRRAGFLPEWYNLAHKSLADHLAPSPPMQGKGQPSSDAFELAIANACSAAGLAVLFGGTPLGTPGIDFIAFSETTRRAYPVSATISTRVAEKTREWLRVRASVQTSLAPLWEIRPLVVSASPRAEIALADLAFAQSEGVAVITAEGLVGVAAGGVPGLEAFRASLDTAP